MPSAELVRFLNIASWVGAALLSWRLFATGLWRKYPFFFSYFIFRVFNTLWPLIVPNRTSLYENLWMVTEPISWIFHILVVVELCRLVLDRHTGIYSLLRWSMYGSLAVAITISILAVIPKFRPTARWDTKRLGIWFAAARGIDFALAIFLLLILFFLSRYPVRLNRNILLHSGLYTVFFFGGAFTVFFRTFFGSSVSQTNNLILEFISAGCILAWVFLLTTRGEQIQTSFRHVDARHEQIALRQLENLNATLLKAAGK